MARGGKRAGAGRPRGARTYPVSVRVSHAAWSALSTQDVAPTTAARDVLERWAAAQLAESERVLDEEAARARRAADAARQLSIPGSD